MTDAELWAAWRFWLGVTAAIVIVAAALLVAILVTAGRILAEAERALAAAESIERRTRAIWELQRTNETAARMLASVRSLEARGAALVRALGGQPVGRG